MREKLYDKLEKEYLEYIDKLKQLTVNEVIDKSYETAIKNEITYYFKPKSEYFNDDQIRVLNKFDNPLEEIYDDWLRNDFGIGDVIKLSIDDFCYYLLEDEKEIEKREPNKDSR